MILLNQSSLGSVPVFLSNILDLDRDLFLKINNSWTNSFLDGVFPWWRDATTWMPLYLFLLLFIFLNFGWKAWPWVLGLIITVSITDQVSSNLLKNWVNRPRPCNDELLKMHVNLLINRCPVSGSFPSSHATNHFGVAVFLYMTLHKYFGKWALLFFAWAATISYGQVYVGVHYPIDIIGGAIIGSIIGYLTASLFLRRIGMPPLVSAAKT
ncbi:MAG: phosphatase PAP2 family protein [Chitinophagaceae bacterium]